MLAIVIGATLIVLFLMTGSVVLPIKAVMMNVLSLSAVFGILVLIFQDGHLQGLLGYHAEARSTPPSRSSCSRSGSGWPPTTACSCCRGSRRPATPAPPTREAVAIGLERTGRIVTAAAILFAVAIGAFATSQIVFIKELGIGDRARGADRRIDHPRAAGPSLMELLGPWNWWAPPPLRRLYERIGLREGAPPLPAPS